MLCPVMSKAQVRYGFETSAGMVFNDGLEAHTANGDFIAEIILPRKWTPNWLALSCKVGAGVTSLGVYCDEENNIYFDREIIAGMSIPVKLEAKYLITNSIRFYANAGMRLQMGFLDEYDEYYDNYSGYYDSDYESGWNTGVAAEFGAGFEFGWFRIGYQYTRLPGMVFHEDYNGSKGVHGFSLAFMFNGSRMLKKSSKLKVY